VRKHLLLAAAAGAALGVFLWPGIGYADNCGSMSDCYHTARAALAALIGLSVLFGVMLSLALDFTPGVGTVKGIIEAFTGRDLITGQELAWWERLLGVVPVLGGLAGAAAVARGIDRAADAADAVRDASRATDAARDVSRAEDATDAARDASRAEDAAEAAREARKRQLGHDPATGRYRPAEGETALRVEEATGVNLTRSPDPRVDWVDANTGKTYDAVGNFPAKHFDRQWPNLQTKIIDHLAKADFVPIDVSQFTPDQIAKIQKFITDNGLAPRAFLVGQ
jgi:hypothetical protein